MLSSDILKEEPSGKSSAGIISSTDQVPLTDSIILTGKNDLLETQNKKSILDTVSPKKDKPLNEIRKISSGSKQVQEKEQKDAPLFKSPARKITHTDKENQALESFPRMVNNRLITKSICLNKPLASEQLKKLEMNYLFYVKDKQLTIQYQKLKREGPCFKINMMKSSPAKKEMQVLFSSLIEQTSHHFHVNPLAALDILELHISQNSEKYTSLNFVNQLKANGTLRMKNKDELEVNTSTVFVKQTLKTLGQSIKQQIEELQIAFLSASKLKYKIFKSKSQVQQCCENLWDSFRYYYFSSPLDFSRNMEQIVQILLSLTKIYQQQFSGSFVAGVLQTFDECLTKKYISNQLIIKLVVRLLRLDIVNLTIKGVHIDPRENIFNHKTKEVRNILAKLESYELLPFKVILSQIDKSLDNTYGCQNVIESDQVRYFGMNKRQIIVEGSYWLDWLQIWIQQIKGDEGEQVLIALACLYNCFEAEYDTFWINSHTKRFSNSKWLLKEAMRQNLVKQVFEIMQKLIGNEQNPYSEQTYAFALQIFGQETIQEIINQRRPTEFYIPCIKFLAKLISFDTRIVKKIETEIFQTNKKNQIVYFLLNTLDIIKDVQLVETVFKALNNLLLTNPTTTLTEMTHYQLQHKSHSCLDFMARPQIIFKIKPLLTVLCDHFNILVAQPSALKIMGQQSQWINRFRAFEPWRVINSDTVKCIKFLIKRWSIDLNNFWTTSLKSINIRTIFEPILQHFYEKRYNEDIYENKILRNFSNNNSEKSEIIDIKLLIETLLLLQTTLNVLQKLKIHQYRPGIPQIIETVLFTFVYDIETFKETRTYRSEKERKVHPLLIFINMFSVSETLIRKISEVTFENISELSIDILVKILKLSYLNSNSLNQLFDVFKPEQNQQNNLTIFYSAIARKVKSNFVIDKIIQFMIFSAEFEKILLKNLTSKLKRVFIQCFEEIFLSQQISLKNKVIVLLLKLHEGKKIYAEFLKELFSSSNFWILVTRPQESTNFFNNYSLQKEIEKIGIQQKSNVDYLKENLTRLSLLANTSKLVQILMIQENVQDKQVLLKTFFQIYDPANIFLLFNNTPNFDFTVLDKSIKFAKFASENNQKQMNDFLLNFENCGGTPDLIIMAIIKANTIAFSNVAKLFVAVIGTEKVLNVVKSMLPLKDFDRYLRDTLFNFILPLNQGKIKYTTYVYYILGLGVQLLGRQGHEIIDFLVQDTRWLKYKDDEQKQGVFFLIESADQVKYKSQQFEKIVEFMVENSKIDLYAINFLKLNYTQSVLNTSINQLQNPTNLNNFISACHCISFQLINFESKPESYKINYNRIVSVLCATLKSLSVFVEQIPFYRNDLRNPEHIVWCWSLLLMRTINTSAKTTFKGEHFHELVIVRCETILRELNESNFILTRGFKQEIELLSQYFSSLLLKKIPLYQRCIDLVQRIWKRMIEVIVSEKNIPVTEFEKILEKAIVVNQSGGMYSMRSVSPLSSFNMPSERIHTQSSSISNTQLSKNKLTVSPRDLREQISSFQIIYNLLFFIKSTYNQSNIRLKTCQEWQQNQKAIDRTFKKVFQFFQRSYGVMQVKQLLNSLNQSYFSMAGFNDSGYLNTLHNQFSIEALNSKAKVNIYLLNQIVVLHVRQISQSNRQSAEQHRNALISKIDKTANLLTKYKHLSNEAGFLKSFTKEFGYQLSSRIEVMPKESKFISSIMSKLSI